MIAQLGRALNERDEANRCLEVAFEIIASQQDIIAAQATLLLMVSLDLPNVRQPVKVSTIIPQDES